MRQLQNDFFFKRKSNMECSHTAKWDLLLLGVKFRTRAQDKRRGEKENARHLMRSLAGQSLFRHTTFFLSKLPCWVILKVNKLTFWCFLVNFSSSQSITWRNQDSAPDFLKQHIYHMPSVSQNHQNIRKYFSCL